MLEFVVALTVIATSGDGFIDEIPCFHLASACLHHSAYPFVHSIDEGVVALLRCERDGGRHIDVFQMLADDRCHCTSAAFLHAERRDISAFEVAIFDALFAINLETYVVEIVIVGISQFAEIEGNALSCLTESA